MGLIENTPTGKLILTQMLAFAEFERDMIVELTQEGKTIVRLYPNFKERCPNKFTKDQIEHALFLLQSNTTKEVSKLTGISEATLYRKKRIGPVVTDNYLKELSGFARRFCCKGFQIS